MPTFGRIPTPPRLNRGNKLAAGLICALVPTPQGAIVDLVGDRPRTGPGAATLDRGNYGLCARDWSVPAAQAGDVQLTSGPFTVAALGFLQHVADASYCSLLGTEQYASEANNQGWNLQLRGDGTGWAFFCGRNSTSGAGQESVCDTSAGTVGDHLIVGTSNGSNLRALYTDGLGPRATSAGFVNPLAAANLFNVSTATIKAPVYYALIWNRCLSANDVLYLYMGGGVDLLSARPNRVRSSATLVGPAGSSVAFAASLNDAAIAASLVAAVPPPASVTFTATSIASLSSSLTATVPPASSFVFIASVDSANLASSFAATVPNPSSFDFAAASTNSVAASFTAVVPASSSFAVDTRLDAAIPAASVTSVVPPPSILTLATTLDSTTLTSTLAAAVPAASTFVFATDIDAARLASTLTATVPPPSTLAFSETAGPAILASDFLALVPTASAFVFASALDPVSIASSLVALVPPPTNFGLAVSLDGAKLSSTFTAAVPSPASFTVAATLAGPAILAGNLTAAVPSPSSFTVASILAGPASLSSAFTATVPAPSSFVFSGLASPPYPGSDSHVASNFLAAAVIISRPSFLHDRSGSRHPN